MKLSAAMLTVLLLNCVYAIAQTNSVRTLEAKRTNGEVKIDGKLNDAAWKDAAVMTDLIEFRPNVGAMKITKTEALLI